MNFETYKYSAKNISLQCDFFFFLHTQIYRKKIFCACVCVFFRLADTFVFEWNRVSIAWDYTYELKTRWHAGAVHRVVLEHIGFAYNYRLKVFRCMSDSILALYIFKRWSLITLPKLVQTHTKEMIQKKKKMRKYTYIEGEVFLSSPFDGGSLCYCLNFCR